MNLNFYNNLNLWKYYEILPEILLIVTGLFFFICVACYKKFNFKATNLNFLLNYILILYLLNIGLNSIFVEKTYKCVFIVLIILYLFLIQGFNVKEKYVLYQISFLILIVIFGLLSLFCVNDFIFFYMILELISLSLFVIVLYTRFSIYSLEGSLKYFMLGSISSSILLMGLSLFYGLTGSFSFNEVYLYLFSWNFMSDSKIGLFFAVSFILLGIFFKLGLAPMHVWLPDVYEGSSILVVGFLSTIVKFGVLILFFRLYLFVCFNLMIHITHMVYLGAILSIIVGSIGGLFQTKIKRLWAYSSISHMGFILISFLNYNLINMYTSIIYNYIYILVSFSILGILLHIRRFNSATLINHLNDLSTLQRLNFEYAVIFILGMFSLAGIPPLSGFFSKILVFINLCNSREYFLVCILILFSVISSFYYLRLVRMMLFNKSYKMSFNFEVNKAIILLLFVLAAFNLFFIKYFSVIIVFFSTILQNI